MIADLLWTAPELLRGPRGPWKATFKGDVFSLGIILQEVLTQGPPYCSWGLSAEGTCPSPSWPPWLLSWIARKFCDLQESCTHKPNCENWVSLPEGRRQL